MTAPLTPERVLVEAVQAAKKRIVSRFASSPRSRGMAEIEGAFADIFAEIDRLLAELAAAEARGREAMLREAVVACDRIIASEPLSAYANSAKCCRAAILSLIGTPPPPQGGSEWKPTHRHYKGGLYRVLYRGLDEPTETLVTVYEGEDRTIWVRPEEDFEAVLPDGRKRFESIAYPVPQGGSDGR